MNTRSPSPTGVPAATGFPGGTLVHTDRGLVPIEHVKASDRVLARRHDGEGEREYRPVTNTFEHHDQAIQLVYIGGQQEDGTDRYHLLAASPEHMVWVRGKGWKQVGTLKHLWPRAMMLELLSADLPKVAGNVRLYATSSPGMAWLPMTSVAEDLGRLGSHLDVARMQVARSSVPLEFEAVIRTKRSKPEHWFKATVHDLQVEEFNSYHVGAAGVRVHGKAS